MRFFKTGKGEYGEGDVFAGLTVPESRTIAKNYYDLDRTSLEKLLTSKIHEERLIALIILIKQFEKSTASQQKNIFNFYLAHAAWINNWDLVDMSAPNIVGAYLLNKPKRLLLKLVKSKLLWERRIAIVATFTFIRANDYAMTLLLAEKLLLDTHDLIHKSVGWMLREVGKRSPKTLTQFLNKHAARMPRTMLRYALERLAPEQKMYFMKMKERYAAHS